MDKQEKQVGYWFCLLLGLLLIGMTTGQAFAQTPSQTGAEQQNPEQQSPDPAEAARGFDSTIEMIKLFQAKGLISEKEAQGFLQRYEDMRKKTGQVVTITAGQEQQTDLQAASKDTTDRLNRELNNLKESYEFRSEDLIRKTILLEREIKRLEEEVTEVHKPKLQQSSWAQRIRFGGDIRLRHESVLFDKDNARDIEDPNNPGAGNYINTTNDVHRQRARVRLGVKAKIIDPGDVNIGKVEAGIRIATGSVSNPVSTNHTLGHTSNDRADVVLDRAYVKYTFSPEEEIMGSLIPQLSLTGGIMSNPWMSSALVYDSDLAFEGIALNLLTDTNAMNSWSAFLTAGYFPLDESERSQRDKYMRGVQAGFTHRPVYGWEYRIAAAYYDFVNMEGKAISSAVLSPAEEIKLADWAPKHMQKGNSLFSMSTADGTSTNHYGLLSEFKLLNVTGQIENSRFFPVKIRVYWDWVKNMGYDAQEMAEKSALGVDKAYIESVSGDTGYLVGLKIGYLKPRRLWDWNVFVEYRYLESDAVLDGFADSDFHLGGTNSKGFIVGAELGLYENVWLNARWMSANEIDDMQYISNSKTDDLSVDTLQFSVNAEF